MKKETFLKILRILFCLAFFSLALFVLFHPKKTETNILKAILSDSEKDTLLVDLSRKHAGRFNIIFESENLETADSAQKEFLSQGISKDSLKEDFTKGSEVSDFLNTYKLFSRNLLSDNTAKEIKNNDLEQVKLESLERLYNPLAINLLPIEEDPFMLFNDFLNMLGSTTNQSTIELDGKYYLISNLALKDETALSPSLLNKEMSKVVKAKDKIEKNYKDLKIYLTGAPVHTYYASSKSMKEINLICILSSLFIILLCRFYFKSFKILVPIASSLFLGMTGGYLLTSLFFDSIHILTFVFSSTLIGICVDYSLHYFAHNKNLDSIFRSLTVSMLTTISAFLILLFSNIELLEQIAVFTASGLICVYLFVILFYPVICKNIEPEKQNFPNLFGLTIPERLKHILTAILAAAILIGLFRIKFNNEIKDMYKPPKYLAYAEELYTSLIQSSVDTTFLLVKGTDIQSIIENEEEITKYLNQDKYISLSKFVPSVKKQKENRQLIDYLYKRELNNYADFLPQTQRQKLLNQPARKGFLTVDKVRLPILKEFLTDKNTSVIILQNENPKTIKRILDTKPDVRFIDLKNDISARVSACTNACIALIVPIILILFTGLSILYRPKNAFKILLPSLCGGLITLGVLGLLNRPVNLFHILALFLIAGFSLDYSIFRFNSSKNTAVSHEQFGSDSAVLISCATSAFSFFLLSMTSFKLISSLGFVLALGLVSSYIFSLLLISKD